MVLLRLFPFYKFETIHFNNYSFKGYRHEGFLEVRVILTKPVKRWLDKEKSVHIADLCRASDEIINNIFDADLGGSLYKKRISNNLKKGKSGGSRLLVAYKKNNNLFFLFVFNKSETENISNGDKKTLKERAKAYFELDDQGLNKAIKAKILFEIDLLKAEMIGEKK